MPRRSGDGSLKISAKPVCSLGSVERFFPSANTAFTLGRTIVSLDPQSLSVEPPRAIAGLPTGQRAAASRPASAFPEKVSRGPA
jgi:hypothetical protein